MTIEELKKQCEDCTRCPLHETRNHVVFGAGDPHARILFVGEAPGKNEDLQGLPFVGRAGDLLNSYLDAVGIRREEVYISNIVKCRPPENRDPLPAEQDACIDWLRQLYRLIDPKIVVCLGRIAAKRMIKDDFKVTVEHGQIFQKNGTLMMGTFHPAALLRNPSQKGAALDDFQKLAALIERDFQL